MPYTANSVQLIQRAVRVTGTESVLAHIICTQTVHLLPKYSEARDGTTLENMRYNSTIESGAKIVPHVKLSYVPQNRSRGGAILSPFFQ